MTRAQWLLLILALTLASLAFASEMKFPPLTGRVVDDAGVLDPWTQSQLSDMLAAHERATGQQVVVVTLPSLQGYTIEDYGYQLGRYWGIGQKGRNNGALLIVAPKEHKVRIEVGYGLEGELTDAICATIIQNYILPSFKRGDYSAGVLAGATSILKVLGGNPVAISKPATEPAQGRFAPSVPVNVPPPGFPQVIGIVLGTLLGVILNPIFLLGTLLIFFVLPKSANRRGWDSGGGYSGGSSGGGGGGGFSGGGGSFGGGGASGSW